MHANNNTWLRRLFINGTLCEWENRWQREYKTSDWQLFYMTLAISAHAVNKPQGRTDKTRRCPMAISVKTSLSVSEGNQLVVQLSIKQPLISGGVSHSKYRVDKNDAWSLSVVGGCVCVFYCLTFWRKTAYITYTYLVEGHVKGVCTKNASRQ